MNECKIIQVIKTTLKSKGDGVNEVYRTITQYWSLDGKLLFEFDPLKEGEINER